ncbi:MAG: SDR family oxidoreductase [Alphaproteobacteria bacterium]|nr:SDR family oxidoreductase [Alphaproteobacteria bacterium]
MTLGATNATLETASAIAPLVGKVALVTGGTAGIGQSTCVALAKAGAYVYVTGRAVDPERPDLYGGAKGGSETVHQINEIGGKGIFVKLDVTIEDDWIAMAKIIKKEHGKLDLLLNNAGRGRRKPIEQLTTVELWDQIDLNIGGAFLGMTHCWSLLAKAKGVVMNMNSTAGQGGGVNSTLYGSSKGGMGGLTKSAAIDAKAAGIRVISVHPGSTWTPGMQFISKVTEQEYRDNMARERGGTPLGYPAYPLDVAAAVIYLASDAARHINGIEINIDGGASAR